MSQDNDQKNLPDDESPDNSSSNSEAVKKEPAEPAAFSEALAILDDNTWMWNLVQFSFTANKTKFVKLPSTVTVRQSWDRFKETPCIVIHWEARGRSGGAIIEEILDIEPNFDIPNKVIVLTTNPIHEDVVYFSELGIRRIVRLRNRDKELETIRAELVQHIKEGQSTISKSTSDVLWRKIHFAIDRLPALPPASVLVKIEHAVAKMEAMGDKSARILDAKASIALAKGHDTKAFELWTQALELNPNFFRAYNKMIEARRAQGEHEEAYSLLQKMQLLNRNRIARLVAMGETQVALNDDNKAQHYFQAALEKDGWCSGALNGLADISFRADDLDNARNYLEKSNLCHRYASQLNYTGIELVKQGKFAEALEHYSKAQYVLPQQEKGPQLFFNIGLCYSRWNKPQMAREFLKLALIKEPNYKKAQRLLDQIQQHAAPENTEKEIDQTNAKQEDDDSFIIVA